MRLGKHLLKAELRRPEAFFPGRKSLLKSGRGLRIELIDLIFEKAAMQAVQSPRDQFQHLQGR